jgi:hypothetical protein
VVDAQWRRWRPGVLELRAALAVRAQEARVLAARLARDIRHRWATFRSHL